MIVEGLIIRQGKDTVAVVTADVKKGDTVSCKNGNDILKITVLEDIPVYHKISLKDMKKGDTVIKYGEAIGKILEDISKGSYIHIHNLGLMEEKG